MDILKLTQEKLSVGDINDQVALESCGAISIFIGTTRDNFDGKKVARLEYESYETMAIKALKNICSEIRSKWVSVGNIAIYHRLGCVPVKEASVVIAISSPHRAESLEAVSFCIEKLKGNVPIWKKEIYDGELEKESVWKENKECSWSRPQDNNEPILIQPSEISHNNKELVQLNVSFEELQWRINNFIERKRDQVNINNRHDFIQSDGTVDTLEDGKGLAEDTCARVRTLFLKRGDSKGHLKVHRAYNQWGPQTVRPESQTKNGSKNDNQRAEYRSTNPALEERFSNIEDYLNISKSPVPSDIYKRLKIMEDRISHLETISPEYSVFWDHNRSENFKETHDGPEAKVKCLFTARDIDKKINEMENQTSF